jgi:RsiW-degrading membrane proteinase PrsW (M82 family)
MGMSYALISLLAAIIPMVFYLIVIWKLDRYDREPIWLVTLNFLWGAVGAVIFGFLGSLLLLKNLSPVFYRSMSENLLGAVIVAPFIEEIAKGIFLLFVTSPMKDFDNMTDGVVYGAAIGLGFGMTENFLYFLTASQNIEQLLYLIIIRSILSAVMHACSTAAFGAFIGYAKFHSKQGRKWLIPLGLITAMFIHFFWNYSVTIGNIFIIGALFIVSAVAVIFILFQISLSNESKLIKKELSEEAEIGTIPIEHLNFLPYTHLRARKGWLAPKINQDKYIKIATNLAFRKQQSRTCPERKKAFYMQEVEDAREEISHLLYGTPI